MTGPAAARVEPLAPADVERLRALAAAAGLPAAGIGEPPGRYWVARGPAASGAEAIIGGVGLERYRDQGLLRSLVVAAEARGRGVGTALLAAAQAAARESALREVVLLTATAAGFFRRHGFEPVPRSALAGPVATAPEVTELCPETATVLRWRPVPEVLFVCVHNAGRSQMAAALLEHRARGRVRVRSAGSEPASALHPGVLAAMAEIGLDLRDRRPALLTDAAARSADVVVTMGCGDACPIYPGTRHLDWAVPDPAGLPLEAVRPIRDAIDRRVRELLTTVA